jgi:hypothetical protein
MSWRLGGRIILPSLVAEAAAVGAGTIQTGHDLEKIVVGNEPAVSGGTVVKSSRTMTTTPCSAGAPSRE